MRKESSIKLDLEVPVPSPLHGAEQATVDNVSAFGCGDSPMSLPLPQKAHLSFPFLLTHSRALSSSVSWMAIANITHLLAPNMFSSQAS